MSDRTLRAIALGATGLYAALGAAFAVFGRVNGDEGWYLVAARLALRGELPYADFAYTQMPLLPYVYGVPQLAAPGLLTGRLTSLALGVGAVSLCVGVARVRAGRGAAAAVAVLAASALAPLYFTVLVKTYALAAFLLAATLAALVAPGTRRWSDPLAVAAAVALALVRTSGLPLALLVVAWCVLRAPDRRTRAVSAAVAALGAAVAAAFLLAAPAAARYLLADFHQIWWYDATPAQRVETILASRIPVWLLTYAPFWALAAAALAAAWRAPAARDALREAPGLGVVFLGTAAFLATHLLPGQFGPEEYFTPALPVLVTTSVVVLARALPAWPHRARVGTLAVAGLAAVAAVQPSVGPFLVARGDPGSPAAVRAVARFLREYTAPGDEVLALWHQAAVVDADRDVPPGFAMGIFSYVDMPTPRATALHLVNAEQIASLLRARRPAAVVLGDFDLRLFEKAGTLSKRHQDPARLLGPLDARYAPAFRAPGQGLVGPESVRVYLPRAGATDAAPQAGCAGCPRTGSVR